MQTIKSIIEGIKDIFMTFWKAIAPLVVSLGVLFAYGYYKDMRNAQWQEAKQAYFTAFNQCVNSYQSYKDILQRVEEAENKYTFRNEAILNSLNKANQITEIHEQTYQEAQEAFDFYMKTLISSADSTLEERLNISTIIDNTDKETYLYYAELLNQHTHAQEALIQALQEYIESLILESLKISKNS